MKNPTSEQMDFVIENLESIRRKANKEGCFDMDSPNLCGTVHCLAGWYSIACWNRVLDIINDPDFDYGPLNYNIGIALMTKDLGFKDMGDLQEWAVDNPNIWGNEYGGELFLSCDAYNGLKDDSKNPMTIIIKHFKKVRNNLKKLESK